MDIERWKKCWTFIWWRKNYCNSSCHLKIRFIYFWCWWWIHLYHKQFRPSKLKRFSRPINLQNQWKKRYFLRQRPTRKGNRHSSSLQRYPWSRLHQPNDRLLHCIKTNPNPISQRRMEDETTTKVLRSLQLNQEIVLPIEY